MPVGSWKEGSHSSKLEFLALKWAVTEQFCKYLQYQPFTVWMDNNQLTYILTTANAEPDEGMLLVAGNVPGSCEAFLVDVHVMPLGELYRYCWFLGYFNNFHDMQEHITWKLLFQTDLHILLTNIDTIESLSNEWHRKIQMFPLNSIFHGWPISVIRLDLVLTSRLILVSNPAGSRPLTARLAESHLFMWLGYLSVWKILNGTAHASPRCKKFTKQSFTVLKIFF